MKLPKIYNNEGGNFPQHKGKPKISYSQFTSWRDVQYRDGYILQYMFGIEQPTNIYALFGGEVGEYIEAKGNGTQAPNSNLLSQEDMSILDKLEYPENSVYEEEIVLDCGDFVIQGFTDRTTYFGKKVDVIDFKTGNIDKKAEYYAEEAYGQTTLYCYAKEQEGYIINSSSVMLLGRKGNDRPNHPVRLSGDNKEIPTPYSIERAERVIAEIRQVALEISDCYSVFLKLNK